MHIEPGIVNGAKIVLSYGTAAASIGIAARFALDMVRDNGVVALLSRSVLAAAMTFIYFEVFPHYPVGVSEVHLIMGSTLFLLFGLAPAAIGLAAGLLLQGLLFAPLDLQQYGINLTTLLIPLFAMGVLAKRLIAPATAYKDITYVQALALSTAYQSGIISWVVFWAFYGQGFGAENLAQVSMFGLAYLSVIIIEPLFDLGVLAVVKLLHNSGNEYIFNRRLHVAG
jgi:ABC-type Co2+ transport system permease subunit